MEGSRPVHRPLLPVCTNKTLGAHWLHSVQQPTGVALITGDPHSSVTSIDLSARCLLRLQSTACKSRWLCLKRRMYLRYLQISPAFLTLTPKDTGVTRQRSPIYDWGCFYVRHFYVAHSIRAAVPALIYKKWLITSHLMCPSVSHEQQSGCTLLSVLHHFMEPCNIVKSYPVKSISEFISELSIHRKSVTNKKEKEKEFYVFFPPSVVFWIWGCSSVPCFPHQTLWRLIIIHMTALWCIVQIFQK